MFSVVCLFHCSVNKNFVFICKLNKYLFYSGVLISSNIWVSSRTENTLNKWKIYEVNTTLKNGEVVENCDVIFLAVKPHLLDSMVQDTVNTSTQTATSKLFISVLAGVSLDMLMNVSMYFIFRFI